jgi:hypothetical protein
MSSIVTERRGKSKNSLAGNRDAESAGPGRAAVRRIAGRCKASGQATCEHFPPSPSRRHSIRGEPARFSRRGRSPVGSRGDTSPRNQIPWATASFIARVAGIGAPKDAGEAQPSRGPRGAKPPDGEGFGEPKFCSKPANGFGLIVCFLFWG